MAQFETVINEILDTLYHQLSHITVGKGCICVSWAIPDHINASKLVPELPLEFVQIIGVISLHIGDTAIYDIGGEGCETIESAMLQAIELKNTQAIELLLAVGCSPEVATYHEDNAVTNIVNIYKKSSDSSGSGGVDHVCILGHSEHVEAIVDPSIEPQCSSCRSNEKMMRNLQQENDGLHQQRKEDLLKFDSFPNKQGIHYYHFLFSSNHFSLLESSEQLMEHKNDAELQKKATVAEEQPLSLEEDELQLKQGPGCYVLPSSSV